MGIERDRAARWHETDHGAERGKPLRSSKFITALPDELPEYVSSCWCCCEVCDPDWNPDGRSNPFWAEAMRELQQS